MTPPPDYLHDRSSANLIEVLRDDIKRCNYRGKIYVPRAALWIDNDTYLEPDLMYISAELEAAMAPGHWTRADIVVEIISPSNATYDRKTKSDTYRAMGVRELLLIDSEKKEVDARSFEAVKNTVYKIGENLRSEVLPKIEVPVSVLFS